jgi:membrane dipeptidase
MTRSAWTAIAGLLAASALLAGCSGGGGKEVEAASLEARAEALAQEAILIDTHIDVPYRLRRGSEDLSMRTPTGHFDGPRAREGGLDAAFMAIYVPSEYEESGGAKGFADQLIDRVEGIAARWPDLFVVARSPDDLLRAKADGRIALPMGIENGAAIESDLGNLRHFHGRGVRYLTLTHGTDNLIGDSSYSEASTRRWGGLSPFGRRVVEEMNRLGIMVDISHVSDAAFDAVLEVSRAPVIASHSSCRRFTPGFERNLDDDRIRRLAEGGGVIQINFGSMFLTEAANRQSVASWRETEAWMKERGLDWDSPETRERREALRASDPPVPTSVSDVADHIDHVVRIAGIDHVGIGSDFDGVSSLPVGLEDVSGYPNLVAELLRRGYSEPDVRKVLGENLLRVWREVERVAAEGP